ncbi:hypothetical protein ACIHIX_25440 [Streptomyces sp. NPDC051913]|uniref:hypothetical protein n=1 Tax=Streptomyces sp. NPDC051913 TaxID=3365676 RepID=UPI0037CE1B59
MTAAAQRDTTTLTYRTVPKIAAWAAGETTSSRMGHVACHTGELNGLDVVTARIQVTSLAPAMGVSEERRAAMTGRRPRRLWSRRRVPTAAVPAVVATVACGALALVLDLIMVRSAALWPSDAARRLWQHGPGDPSVTLASGLTALLGLWMIVLAVAPGPRRPRTVRSPGPRVAATVDRSAAETEKVTAPYSPHTRLRLSAVENRQPHVR